MWRTQPIFFNPFRSARKHVFAVVIESEDERPIHLDSVIVQHAHPASVVVSLRRLLVRVG